MANNLWPTIHAERAALAADLETLNDDQWATPSMCIGWSVRDVLAHMTAAAETSQGMFLPKLAASGFRFNSMANKDIAKRTQGPPANTLARFKSNVNASKHPPGPGPTWLGETIVHGEDIRRPLGIKHTYPDEALKQVADFYKGSNLLIGAKKRIAGLRLRATDTNWTTGDGPEISGPMVSLVLAMVGRKPVYEDLSGEGVSTLTAR